jgi:hypothetical protein
VANSHNIRPADISQPDADDVIEGIVDVWITRGAQPPAQLAEVLKNYRDLMVYVDAPTTSTADAAQAGLTMDTLFDRLKAGAAAQHKTATAVAAQLRRVKRKEEAKFQDELKRMSFQERCNWAIARWNSGVRV